MRNKFIIKQKNCFKIDYSIYSWLLLRQRINIIKINLIATGIVKLIFFKNTTHLTLTDYSMNFLLSIHITNLVLCKEFFLFSPELQI